MTRILISVATYRRPELLQALIHSLERANLPEGVRVCVVDNDPDGSAQTAGVESSLEISYLLEPRAGIAAARNRGLSAIEEGDDFVVFVDDDERVAPGWLQQLLIVQARYNADVVSGPVVSVFSEETARWITRGGFIQRPRFATGSVALSPATNNTLLSVAYWRAANRPTFDEQFSMTGGSDTAFFRFLRERGATMVWANEAIVEEDVPADRASLRWIWRRGVREGNVTGRLHLRTRGRARMLIDGVIRIVYGAIRQLLAFIAGRGLQAKYVAYVTRGVGWIGASTDRLVIEYARPTEPRKN